MLTYLTFNKYVSKSRCLSQVTNHIWLTNHFSPLTLNADVSSTEMAIIRRQYLLINRSPEEFEHWQESLCIPQALPNALVRFFLDGVKENYTWVRINLITSMGHNLVSLKNLSRKPILYSIAKPY